MKLVHWLLMSRLLQFDTAKIELAGLPTRSYSSDDQQICILFMFCFEAVYEISTY